MKKSDAPEALLAAASFAKPMTRVDVTEMIVMARLKKGLTWAKLAKAIGQSKKAFRDGIDEGERDAASPKIEKG